MTQEEKAKAYDEVRKKIAIRFGSNVAEEIFSQFEMSEDERVIRFISNELLRLMNACENGDLRYGELTNAVAWLEKQGEQNPADKIESKFHEGDWIVRELDNTCYQIKKCILNVTNNKYGYDLTNGGYISSQDTNFYHLWTIQDAKDGDVLVASDGSIFLFRGTFGSSCKHYVALATDGAVKFNEGLEHYWETSTAVHPATKEQRDTLEKAMTDAGYTFDFKKKELKKIEQMSTWSEEDTRLLDNCISLIEDIYCTEEEQNWLKSVKNRVQPRQEWSEEDNKKIEAIIDTLNRVDQSIMAHNWNMSHGEVFNWLKSLRPQNRWKPSDEQMEAVRLAAEIGTANNSWAMDVLKSMYQDLKKLKS